MQKNEGNGNERKNVNQMVAADEAPLKQPKKKKDESSSSASIPIVVGIGASAGGLEALETFFRNMPAVSGLAFVVVQHLSPDYKSLMLELLSKHTKMKIFRAEDGMKVEANCVYLIPPKKNLTIFHGKLYLNEQSYQHGLNLPIDIFFRSLAEDMAERSIGIVLSGTGSDGTLGIRAIKGAGGMVMVQDDQSAKFDGMPKSAISTGLVDYILSPDNMPEQLLRYTNHPYIAKPERKEREATIEDEDTLSKILALIRTKTGTDFTYYKPNTIVRRIERRISINQMDSIDSYYEFMQKNLTEATTLYKELLIGVTKFFRDTEAFDILVEKVLPKVFQNKSGTEPIRIWDVGCSTGEEAYSLAILLREYMDTVGKHYDVKIFATDIDRDSIEYASAGIYPESIAADITEDRLKRFFRKVDDKFKINESIRQMVIFATHSIIKDPPFSKIDMVACRNLLIYLQPIMQKKVMSAFSFSLTPNGFLFLGSSESVGELSNFFSSFSNKWKIYQSKDGSKPPIVSDYYIPVHNRRGINLQRRDALITKDHNAEMLYDKIQANLFKDYVPPAIIVDENYELLHVYNDVNKFLKVPVGKVNLNVMNMINPGLSIALGTAIHKALKDRKEIVYKELTFSIDEKPYSITMSVKPFQEERTQKNFILIVFEEHSFVERTGENVEEFVIDSKINQRIEDLGLELKYTKESLQATIEELETSNEELQATNQELIAANEELQSTNEELQSVNEELYTVNSEYQNKIEELTELNNDINNWFSITNIGAIFLDLNLRIRKFTPGVIRFVNLIDNDLGRPITHISYNFYYPNFFTDIEEVMKTLQPKETEVQTPEGSWLLMKLLPYRTIENAVKGIVITFINITEIKSAEKRLAMETDLLMRVLDHNPIGEVMLDKFGKITFINKKAESLLNVKKSNALNNDFYHSDWKVLDFQGNEISEEKRIVSLILKIKKSVYDAKERILKQNGDEMALLISGSPIYDENRDVNGAVLSFIDYKENLARG